VGGFAAHSYLFLCSLANALGAHTTLSQVNVVLRRRVSRFCVRSLNVPAERRRARRATQRGTKSRARPALSSIWIRRESTASSTVDRFGEGASGGRWLSETDSAVRPQQRGLIARGTSHVDFARTRSTHP